ncbi:MAG: VWA domain-containing protein [Planctomycetaceae bacterium]|nr:VWA domain-containing protein [Planctomycetaceae bacterium]
MNWKQSVRSVFPPRRGPVTLRDGLPLVIFLVIYAATVIALEQTQSLLFTRRAAFGLMIVSVWVWWMWLNGASGLDRKRGLVALITRLILIGLFVMVIAEPRSVRTSDTLTVVFAVDSSDSVGDAAVERAMDFVAIAGAGKPDKDNAGVVFFGRNAAVELPPRQSFPFEKNKNVQITPDATDLERALTLSAAMIPEETRGRIVLVSDGTQTTGSLDSVVDQLASRGISVDVLPIEYQYDREMWIERVDLPRFVKLGENYNASVLLSSLVADKAKLILRENSRIISEQDIKLEAGKTRIDIPIKVGEPGYYEYKATIETEEGSDHLTLNNSVLNYLYVEGQGKVLIVHDPAGDPSDWESLARAIREGERDVQTLEAYGMPRDPLSLMPYDCVVFVNVGQDAFDTVQLQALHDAVYNQGIGFLMVGGPNSFGAGGYHRTVVEDALPVSMDITQKKILPKGALAIILHTCEFPEGNTWGQRITKQAMKVLSEQDEVGVLASIAGGDGWVFELTPAGQYDELVKKINGLGVGDMGAFGPTMKLGLDGLKKSDAATKHMIIISDGDPAPPPPQLINEFIKEEISISMVAIFPHGGADISKMRAIASATGGRYYFPADPNELPKIFIKEAKTLKRSMVQEKTFTPEVEFPSQVLDGIEALPPLHGYVLSTSKPMAETVLVTRDHMADIEETDPVLAIWRYGLATTAAFTSDLSPAWGSDWVNWEQYRAFVTQLLTRVSRIKQESDLRMWTYMSGGDGIVMVEDFHPDESFLDLKATVAGPRDRTQTVDLKQVGPRRYQATFPLWGTGRYQVMAVGASGEREDRVHGGFIVPYSPEYLRFRSDPIALDEIRERTGGVVLDGESKAEDVFNRRQPKQSTQPIFDWFLMALACLIPIDVGIRRVQLDWQAIKNWLGLGKRDASTETMGALLRRKESLDTKLDKGRPRTPWPTSPSAPTYDTQTTPTRTRPIKPTAKPQASQADSPETTTSRLLELKRRRKEEE